MSRTIARHRTLSLRSHGTAGTISSVEWGAAPRAALECSPACLACEDGIVEAVEGTGACAVDERCVAEERDVVEAEIPDGGVDHAVGGEGHDCADEGSGEDVVLNECQHWVMIWNLEEERTQLWNSSIVRAPPIKTAPRSGAYKAMIFHMAG